MSKVNKDGYTDCFNSPNRFDTYLVKTIEGCYDFAHFENGIWHKGINTGGAPDLYIEIPTTDEGYNS